MNIVILGNGILALTTAFRLAQKASATDKITIVGIKSRPGSATLAAAAMLNSFAEIDEGALDSDIDLYRFELSHLATQMWPRFVDEIMEAAGSRLPDACSKCEGLCGGCFDRGTYVINNTVTDQLDDRNFEAIVRALKQFDEPFSEVAPGEIPNYNPEPRSRATRAIYIPNEGWLNPRLTLEALEASLTAYPQVEYVDGDIASLAKRGDVIETVLLKDGRRIGGDKFFLATGATLSDIVDRSELGISVQRIFYGVGVSIEIKSPEYPHKKCIRTPNRGLACGLYTAPYFTKAGGPVDSVLIGASNFISPVPQDYGRVLSVEHLLRSAMEQVNVNFYRAGLARVNVGWRPTTSDTYPLLGRTSIPNLVIGGGTKRDGFHLAPVISQFMAALIRGESVDERLHCFHPERKLIRSLTRKEAIDKAVEHIVNAAYQHGFSPSRGRMADQVAKMHRDDLERLHDKVGAVEWGIPPEMLDMYRYGHIK